MTTRISERELIIPSLWCISRSVGRPISTSVLQDCLRSLLRPSGEDLLILAGRNDDRFSQKVRNLRSHKTLEQLGLATYESRGSNGYWAITERGQQLLGEHLELIRYILGNDFDYDDTKEAFRSINIDESTKPTKGALVWFDENVVISEGEKVISERQVYTRSMRLREAAIKYYSRDGMIVCQACKFDFQATYGDLGRGFIEIHHVKPIFMYESEDMEKRLQDALGNVVPLCSNCHRMVHRRRGRVMPIVELTELIRSSRSS